MQLQNSEIEIQNQTVRVPADIVGTPFSLYYHSDRVPGHQASSSLTIPLREETIPESLERIDLEISIAGQKHTQSFTPAEREEYTFTWDGKDAYGRPIQGTRPVTVRIGYVYKGVYYEPDEFEQSFARFAEGRPKGGEEGTRYDIVGDEARQEITLWQEWTEKLNTLNIRAQGMEGWSIDAHHIYSPANRTLLFGDGDRRNGTTESAVLSRAVGVHQSEWGRGNDSGLATEAKINPARVAVGPNDDLYIADSTNHCIRRISSEGIITTVAGTGEPDYSGDDGPAIEAQLHSPHGIAVGSNGTIYIADTHNRVIRRVDSDGIITTVIGTGEFGYSDGEPATQARLNNPQEVAVSSDTSLYIVDTGNRVIQRMELNGILTTVAGDPFRTNRGDVGPATQASLKNPQGIAVSPDGSFYIADRGYEAIRRVGSDGIITTVAGTGEPGYSGDGGPATEAKFSFLHGVSIGPNGSLYIADAGNNVIRRVGSDGIITTVAGSGEFGYSGDGGPATEAKLYSPRGIAVGPDGSLYIADTINGVIRRVDSDRIITTVAGTQGSSYSGDGRSATGARLSSSEGVAVGPDGSLYIADAGNNVIRRVGSDGIITTVAGSGEFGYSGDGRPATATGARLSFPKGVAVGPDGSLYIADTDNHVIRRVDSDGIITTVAGTGEPEYSGDDGPAIEAQLYSPQGVAIGSDGSLYIADTRNSVIRQVGSDGIITTVAGSGAFGYSGDGGPATATEARLSFPKGVAVGPDGSLYIAANSVIRRVGSDGIITTVAGSGESGYSGDGQPAIEAKLSSPQGVAVSSNGTIYIADTDNRVIRRVDSDGLITTVAGTGEKGYSGDGGLAAQARFSPPTGLAVGSDNNLYIANPDDHVIHELHSVLPGFSLSEAVIISEDSEYIYQFGDVNRHQSTLIARTGAILHEFNYNTNGHLDSITDGDGYTTTIEYNTDNAPTAIIAPTASQNSDGQRTTLSTNGDGYLESITNPAGETSKFEYTPEGLLKSFIDPKGNETTFGYDDLGRLVQLKEPDESLYNLTRKDVEDGFSVNLMTGEQRESDYLVESLRSGEQRQLNSCCGVDIESVRDTKRGTQRIAYPDGKSVELEKGPDPRFGMQAPLLKQGVYKSPKGLTATLSADRTVELEGLNPLSLQSLTETLNVNDRTYTRVYDADSRTFTNTSPKGRQNITTIDEQSRIKKTQIHGLNPTNINYDVRGRINRILYGHGETARDTTFKYDDDGNLRTVTDPLGRTATFEYDGAGRVEKQILPSSQEEREVTYEYDKNGNITSITPPGRPAHRFEYTAGDQVEAYIPPKVGDESNRTQYTYTDDGDLSQVTQPTGTTIGVGYDSAGRPVSITTPRGEITYTFDERNGTLSRVTDTDGGSLDYQYDGDLLTGTVWNGAINGSVGWVYDDNIRITHRRLNGGNDLTYEYDDDGFLRRAGDLTIRRKSGNGLLSGTTLGSLSDEWSYNGFGEPTSYTVTRENNDRYSVKYEYDDAGRIVQRTETIDGETNIHQYTYDSASRLETVTKNGEVVRSREYDLNGNLTKETTPSGVVTGIYDNQDRLREYGNTTYNYSATGDLKTKTADGRTTTYDYDALGNLRSVTQADGTEIRYAIDGENRRVAKYVNGTFQQGFLYEDGLNPAAEIDESGAIISEFVYATQDNVPDYMIKNGVTYRLVSDHLGGPRLVVNIDTGEIAQRMDYDAFGKATTNTNPGFQPFGFAGGLYDTDTTLVRFGVRDYNPQIGQWTTKDPSLFNGKQTNIYQYALSDPVNLVDPTGRTVLLLDIGDGKLTVDPEMPGRAPYTIPVTSGRGSAMNDPNYTSEKNVGPIPPGQYTLDVNDLSDPSALGDALRNTRGDWGDWRVPLVPYAGTETHGRGGFFLHGGQFPGSAGCIDIGGGITGNSVTDQVLKDLRADPDKQVLVIVVP